VTPGEIVQFSELDAAGFLPGSRESGAAFLERVKRSKEAHEEFDRRLEASGSLDVFDAFTVNSGDRIAPELVDEAAQKTLSRYGFAVRHVPGFYLSRAVGLLWGGCMLGDPESGFSVFLLRNVFRSQRKFLNYRREELLAHELCHSARQSLNDTVLEEYFAYQMSSSVLQRYLGNCFITDWDALGFVLPVLLLPVVEMVKALWLPDFPVWIFWLLAAVYPAFLFSRNFWSRRVVNRARRTVQAAGAVNGEAVLFRCTFRELQQLGRMSGSEARQWMLLAAQDSPRWAVIVNRFFTVEQKNYEN